MNIAAGDDLEARFPGLELILFESGGDNLASTFSLDLVDWWMFVIDVAGGDDIPRKRGLGLLRSDLLIVNKTDLAPHVGVNLLVNACGGQRGPQGALGDRDECSLGRRYKGCCRCNCCRSPLPLHPGREAQGLLEADYAGGRTVIRRQPDGLSGPHHAWLLYGWSGPPIF